MVDEINYSSADSEWTFSDAKYIANEEGTNVTVFCYISGVPTFVPMSETNSQYNEIVRRVNAGELTIADAE